jgi:hypothetical protein
MSFGGLGDTGSRGLLSSTTEPELDSHPSLGAFRSAFDSGSDGIRVVELFERTRQLAAAGRIDVVVLTARRLACLYQLALATGMQPIGQCRVVSDRYLDLVAPGEWNDLRILILDDSVVLGTTLFALNDRIVNLVGKNGQVQTASVLLDSDQSADFLLKDLIFEPLRRATKTEVETFSLEAVQALYRHQIPFIADFPVSSQVIVPANQWNEYLEIGPWAVADVTAPLISDESHWSLALVPHDEMVDHVLTWLPPHTASLVESFKVRAYVERVSADHRRIRLVPIAMLGACPPRVLENSLTELSAEFKFGSTQTNGLSMISEAGQHRLIQLFASAAILCVFIGEAGSSDTAAAAARICPGLADLLGAHGLDQTALGLYFGIHTSRANDVSNRLRAWMESHDSGDRTRPYNEWAARPSSSPLLSENDVVQMLWEQRELLAAVDLPEQPPVGRMAKLGLIFDESLSSVFGYISRTRELPQRAQIRSMSSIEEYISSGMAGAARVLNQGLTLPELTDSLCPELSIGPIWRRSLLSLGIDVGNDLGIVVPDTRMDAESGLVYRCYRLGETAYLADKPLPAAARSQSTDSQWDSVSREASRGYPLLPDSRDIGDPQQGVPRDERAALRDLKDVVLDAVPGGVVEHFEGTIVELDANEISVEMVDAAGAPATAVIPRTSIPESEASLVVKGASFYWLLFAEVDSGKRVSKIRFKRPKFDAQTLERASEFFTRRIKARGGVV